MELVAQQRHALTAQRQLLAAGRQQRRPDLLPCPCAAATTAVTFLQMPLVPRRAGPISPDAAAPEWLTLTLTPIGSSRVPRWQERSQGMAEDAVTLCPHIGCTQSCALWAAGRSEEGCKAPEQEKALFEV